MWAEGTNPFPERSLDPSGMAMADIKQQLATLLNKEATEIGSIRKTNETPPRVSIYDVVSAITGMDGNHAGNAYRDFPIHYSEVHSRGMNFKFPGRGQRDTPVTTARGIVEIIMLLPGRQAARQKALKP